MSEPVVPNVVTAPEHHTRRRYEVRHVTTYDYENDVTASYGRACLRPRDTPWQDVVSHVTRVEPQPDVLDEGEDFFGNFSHYLEITQPHRRLAVSKTSIIDVEWPAVDLAALDRWSVAEAAAALGQDAAVDPTERARYLLPSALVTLQDEVRDFAATLAWPERPLGQAIAAVTHEIWRDFSYDKTATSTRTTLPEVLAKRAGVCQDFAHLACAVFRAAGLPSRYVSGYIETSPPPGKVKLAGSDATHAWSAVMVPGGRWVDLDPTNNHLADSRYLVTAWGRDFRDVSPLKGVIFSEGGSSTLTVAVDVVRLD
ncbi:transglutaminase family protein [Luteococcus peritonei]|uniref:Transglutaminase family protein n=1 Tax=Luteococcus peritonei TaxID=88874 RepID=A0ABW4RW41_9ACTN